MFTTGQSTEGAVNYTNANAVCGDIVTGVDMHLTTNAINLTLPKDQACASPIGAKWAASITNWLTFTIDRAGLTFLPGDTCQNPLALHDAILKYIIEAIGNIPPYSLVDCEGNPIANGSSVVTCAEFSAGSTPTITSDGVGAMISGTFSVTFPGGAPFIPAGGYAAYVGDTGTVKVINIGGIPHLTLDTGFTALAGAGISFNGIDARYTSIGPIIGNWEVSLMYQSSFNIFTETPGPGPLTFTKTNVSITLTKIS